MSTSATGAARHPGVRRRRPRHRPRGRPGPADLCSSTAPEPGTGTVFDWSLADGLPPRRPAAPRGRAHPENVADAIRRVRPWGVDVASGVESTPGRRKDAVSCPPLRRGGRARRRPTRRSRGVAPAPTSAIYDWADDDRTLLPVTAPTSGLPVHLDPPGPEPSASVASASSAAASSPRRWSPR